MSAGMKAFAAALLVLCGCSAVLARGEPRGTPPRCTGYVPAILDAAIAAAFVGLAVHSSIENGCDRADGCHNYDPTGLYVVPVIPFGLSGAVGVSREGSCRARLRAGGTTASAR